MLVYRVCRKEEILKLFDKYDMNDIGNYFSITEVNNHHYEPNQKYLHFFKDKDSILHFLLKDKYLCIYDIPEDILKQYEGIGYYLDYFKFAVKIEVDEYAIKCHELSFDYLEKVYYINEEIDLDDYLDDSELTNFLDCIYEKEKGKILILKK